MTKLQKWLYFALFAFLASAAASFASLSASVIYSSFLDEVLRSEMGLLALVLVAGSIIGGVAGVPVAMVGGGVMHLIERRYGQMHFIAWMACGLVLCVAMFGFMIWMKADFVESLLTVVPLGVVAPLIFRYFWHQKNRPKRYRNGQSDAALFE